MELTELNLSPEQMEGVKSYVAGEVTKTKDSYKDFVDKNTYKDSITKADYDKAIATKNKEYNKQIKDLQDELTKYKPVEKSDAEKALEQRLVKLEERENQMKDKEALINLADNLKANKLPEALASYLNPDSDIAKITEIFNKHLLDSSYKPDNKQTSNFTGVTKEQFNKMSYNDKVKLYQENKELYNQLSAN